MSRRTVRVVTLSLPASSAAGQCGWLVSSGSSLSSLVAVVSTGSSYRGPILSAMPRSVLVHGHRLEPRAGRPARLALAGAPAAADGRAHRRRVLLGAGAGVLERAGAPVR